MSDSHADTIREFITEGGVEVVWTTDEGEPERGKQPAIVSMDKEPALAALDALVAELAGEKQSSREWHRIAELYREEREAAEAALAEVRRERDYAVTQETDYHDAAMNWMGKFVAAEESNARLRAALDDDQETFREIKHLIEHEYRLKNHTFMLVIGTIEQAVDAALAAASPKESE